MSYSNYALLLPSSYCCTQVPIAKMFNEPKKGAEVVSETFFSEPVLLVEENEDWIKIQTFFDKYFGWVKKNEVCVRHTPYVCDQCSIAYVSRNIAHLYRQPDTIYGEEYTLPLGSQLRTLDSRPNDQERWLKVCMPDESLAYIQRGDVVFEQTVPLNCQEMCLWCRRFLGIPYKWGGRSSLGFDCSGLVQAAYWQMNIPLLRDSKDQFLDQRFFTIPIFEAQSGDLLFFGKFVSNKIHIIHVGICLGNGEFIHATVAQNRPFVQISKIVDPVWNGSNPEYPYVACRRLVTMGS